MIDEKAAKMEKHLLKTQFPLECEEIPLEDLNYEEKLVVIKCMDYQDLTDDEFKLLKKTLQRYRPAIQKHRPIETIESIEKTVELINTEQELLDILDSPEMKTLRVHLPLNGKTYEFNFEILPLDNSAAVKGVGAQLELFKDFNEKEKQIYTKAQANKTLSREEEVIMERLNKKLKEKANENQEEMIITLLANQLKLPNSSSDLEERKHFWEKFPFNAKVSIFMRLEEKLGVTEYSNEKLFPTSN